MLLYNFRMFVIIVIFHAKGEGNNENKFSRNQLNRS